MKDERDPGTIDFISAHNFKDVNNMAIKTKVISFDWWEAVVEIDDKPSIIDDMKLQVLYWTDGESRIDDADGDVELAYLKMLGAELITESVGYTLEGVLSKWDNKEGYWPLRGEHGFKLVSIDEWDFPESQIQVGDES